MFCKLINGCTDYYIKTFIKEKKKNNLVPNNQLVYQFGTTNSVISIPLISDLKVEGQIGHNIAKGEV